MNALYSLYDALVSIEVPADKARAVVNAMEQDMTSLLATKSDLANTQSLLRQELVATRDSLKQEITAVRDSLKQEITAVRDSLKQEITSVRDSLKQEIDSNRQILEHKLELLRSSMTIRLGSIQIVGMGLLFAALKLT
jgi:predicted  nucleic acid-binding Zn-ribbon protein